MALSEHRDTHGQRRVWGVCALVMLVEMGAMDAPEMDAPEMEAMDAPPKATLSRRRSSPSVPPAPPATLYLSARDPVLSLRSPAPKPHPGCGLRVSRRHAPSASCFFFNRCSRCFILTVDGVLQSTDGLMLASRSRCSLCTYLSRWMTGWGGVAVGKEGRRQCHMTMVEERAEPLRPARTLRAMTSSPGRPHGTL